MIELVDKLYSEVDSIFKEYTTETCGAETASILSSRGLGAFLESKGWKKARHGYEYLKMKESFWGSVFKQRLFVVVLEKSGIEIIIVHKDMDGKLGMEWKYRVKVDNTETE